MVDNLLGSRGDALVDAITAAVDNGSLRLTCCLVMKVLLCPHCKLESTCTQSKRARTRNRAHDPNRATANNSFLQHGMPARQRTFKMSHTLCSFSLSICKGRSCSR
jgi:hypothetical protein